MEHQQSLKNQSCESQGNKRKHLEINRLQNVVNDQLHIKCSIKDTDENTLDQKKSGLVMKRVRANR